MTVPLRRRKRTTTTISMRATKPTVTTMIPHFQEYATTPRAGESARVGVRKRVVLVWYTTHAAVEYRDGNRALVAKDKVTRAKFSMTEEFGSVTPTHETATEEEHGS